MIRKNNINTIINLQTEIPEFYQCLLGEKLKEGK